MLLTYKSRPSQNALKMLQSINRLSDSYTSPERRRLHPRLCLPRAYEQGCRRPEVIVQSHLPSFQPVLQRSSHLEQSKTGLPSFLLTSLWALHSQVPNSPRLPALTGSLRR